MGRFSIHQLSPISSGVEALRTTREKKGLKLTQVSRALKLPVKYLEALEAGEWYELPHGNYARYFLRAYADFLGIAPEPLLQELEQVVEQKDLPITTISTIKGKHLNKPLTHPFRRLLLILVVLGILIYLGLVAWRTFLSPPLNIISPAVDFSTNSAVVVVSGMTKPGVQITINAEMVQVTNEGRFSIPLSLIPGLNTITIIAKKTYSQPVTVSRQVLYTPTAGSSNNPVIP